MNLKTVMPLGLAIVLGLVAAFVAKNAISKRNGGEQATSQVKILVAKRDVAPGKQLTAEDVALSPINGSAVPASAFTEMSQITDRAAGSAGIVAGQPITEPVLAMRGTGSGLQALIPVGMRAVTIEINEMTGLCGMIQPGCMVDVVTTLRTAKGDSSVAKAVLQNVKVAAVGSRVNANPSPEQQDQGPARSVTLLVTAKDAQAIELAASVARPRLVLRSNRDGEPVDTTGVTLAELVGDGGEGFGGDPFAQPVELTTPEPTTKPAEQQVTAQPVKVEQSDPFRTVTVIRAGTESNVKFRIARQTARSEVTDIPTGELPGAN